MPNRHKYANADRVKTHVDSYADGGKVGKRAAKKKRKPRPGMLGTGAASKAAEATSGRKRQIDRALEEAGA